MNKSSQYIPIINEYTCDEYTCESIIYTYQDFKIHSTEKVDDFDVVEPNLIVEEDSTVLEDISPAVNYKEA